MKKKDIYRFQNKIYGNPFLQRDFPSIRAQMQSNVDHKFFYISQSRQHRKKKKFYWKITKACWEIEFAYVYPIKSPRLIVSINCSVTLITSCRLNRTPSSISSLLLDESDDSLIFSSDPSALAFAMTLLPVRNVYLITKVLWK